MANLWKHPDVIAQEALMHLEDSLKIIPMCAKDVTSEFSTKANGWKKGDTVSFRTHGEYQVKEFAGSIIPQSVTTSTRPMKIERHMDISVEVGARELALDLDDFSDQVIKPAMYSLAEEADQYAGTKILEAHGLYVSNGLYETPADIALARKAAILQQLTMNRFSLVDVDLEAVLLGQSWFNQSQTRGKDGENTLRTGQMNKVMGMDWEAALGFPTNETAHTAGNGTALTNNTGEPINQIGAMILTVDGAAGSLSDGDRISVAGCRRPFIVNGAIPSLTGVTSIPLKDPITQVIPDNAAVTVIGSGQDLTFRGAIFDDKAIAVAFPVLDQPEDKFAAVATNKGISVRIVKGYDLQNKVTTLSLDFIMGAFMMDPRRVTLVGEY